MQYLVTGANGYIGSILCKFLKEHGHSVIGVDPVFKLNKYLDETITANASDIYFANYEIDGIFHLGGSSLLNPSFTYPLDYYENNVGKLITLLQHLNQEEFDKPFIFASSAAVYGNPSAKTPVKESDECKPINPYGSTKLIGEKIIEDAAKISKFSFCNCRFFNVAGAYGELGQDSTQPHILTALCRAAADKTLAFKQFGFNVRDYVHVRDVCSALLAAMEYHHITTTTSNSFRYDRRKETSLNISSGIGTCTDEFIDAFIKITGTSPIIRKEGGRVGDPSYLVGDNTLAKELLKWTPYFSSLGDIIESAYKLSAP